MAWSELPPELLLRCVSHLTWEDRDRAAAVSSAWRQAVGIANRQPYWRSMITSCDDPRSEVDKGTVLCVVKMVEQIREGPCPDLCMVFMSNDWARHQKKVLQTLQATLPRKTAILGQVAPGCIGMSPDGAPTELEAGPAISLSLMRLPPESRAHVFFWCPPAGSGLTGLTGDLPQLSDCGVPPHFWLLSGDPVLMEHYMKECARKYPGCTVTGGMGCDMVMGRAPGAPRSQCGRGAVHPGGRSASRVFRGLAGVAFSGPGVAAVPVVVRGVRRISNLYRVDEVTPADVVAGLDGEACHLSRLQPLQEPCAGPNGGVAALAPAGPPITPQQALDAAFATAELNQSMVLMGVLHADDAADTGGGRWLYDPRDVLEGGGRRGQLLLSGKMQVGDTLACLSVDGEQGRRDLAGALERAVQALAGPSAAATAAGAAGATAAKPVVGVLGAVCCGRGAMMHAGKMHAEARVVASCLPGAPLCGFFANGEIGPVPQGEVGCHDTSRSDAMGYTSVYLVLQLSA